MTVQVEVWPLAADETGLWLVSGADCWRGGPVMTDDQPHGEVERAVSRHMLLDELALLHSTSWRVQDEHVVLTYLALARAAHPVRARWPAAMLINLDLAQAAGNPPGHRPVEAPAPRQIDVLMHGLRHLHFLMSADPAQAAAMDPHTKVHLARLEPALATMYRHDVTPAMRPGHSAR